MAKNVRSSKDDPRHPTFAERLEERARDALSSPLSRDAEGFSVSSVLEDEIALMLHQIDRLRARGENMRQSLLHEECDIGTELLQMEQRTPRYSPYRYPEREKLQRRRGRIKEQQRNLAMAHDQRLDTLHDRLLSLLNKHRQLR